MLTMKPKKTLTPTRGPGRPPKHGPTDETGRSGKRISLDLHPDLRDAIDRYAAAYYAEQKVRVGVTGVIEKALIELFERSGLWPPKR